MKEFLNNKKVQLVEFCALGISAAGLLIGGQSAEGISSVVTAVSASIASLAAVAALVRSLLNKENKEEDKDKE